MGEAKRRNKNPLPPETEVDVTRLMRALTRVTVSQSVLIDFDEDYWHFARENVFKAIEHGDPSEFVRDLFMNHDVVWGIIPKVGGAFTVVLLQGGEFTRGTPEQIQAAGVRHLWTTAWHCVDRDHAESMARTFSKTGEGIDDRASYIAHMSANISAGLFKPEEFLRG